MMLNVSGEARKFLRNFLNTSGQKSKEQSTETTTAKNLPQWQKANLRHYTTNSKSNGNKNGNNNEPQVSQAKKQWKKVRKIGATITIWKTGNMQKANKQ